MAWVIGLVTPEELKQLRAIGWIDEDPPESLLPPLEGNEDDASVTRAFFVDNDVFKIMTGEGWARVRVKDDGPARFKEGSVFRVTPAPGDGEPFICKLVKSGPIHHAVELEDIVCNCRNFFLVRGDEPINRQIVHSILDSLEGAQITHLLCGISNWEHLA